MAIGGKDFVADLDAGVVVGDPTKKEHYDAAVENTDFLYNGANVQHDFDETTGDGLHNGQYDGSPTALKNTNDDHVVLWVNSSLQVRMLAQAGSLPEPGSENAGQRVNLVTESSDPLPY